MRITVAEAEPFDTMTLLDTLRQTPLAGFDGALIYADAQLEVVRHMDTGFLSPAQRYVLRTDVSRAIALRESLAERSIDPFDLPGGVWMQFPGDAPGERTPLIPPIIEETLEEDGTTARLISDGMHRVFAARSLGVPITVVLARGVPAEFPYYALPLTDGWSSVKVFDELPDGFQKKEYRDPDNYRALFRLYDSVFPGVQKRRKQSNPDHLRP